MNGPRIVFVLSRYQNAFFQELAQALAWALTDAGSSAIVTSDPGGHRVDDRDVFVLLPPHEYVTLEGEAFIADDLVAARTIGISAEQPHQSFFAGNAAIGARLGAVMDFSRLAVAAYGGLGVEATYLEMGYVPRWDRFEQDQGNRRIDTELLYLGNKRPRRLAVLAEVADTLVGHRAVLRVSDNDEPNVTTSPSFVAGDAKRDVLAGTRLLLNIHQSDEPYFEWFRFIEAAHCGVPVLTESSMSSDPFVAGEHFLPFEREELAQSIDGALADQVRLDRIARAAYDELRARPLADSIGTLVDVARALLGSPPPDRLAPSSRHSQLGRSRVDPEAQHAWRVPGRRSLFRRRHSTGIVVAPDGVRFRGAVPSLELGALIVTCGVSGSNADGKSSLEGIWPWEPWRLLHGQHLGRVMVVDQDLLAASRSWIHEPWTEEYPHVAIQLFAVVHGVAGVHVPRPVAELTDIAVDPNHPIPLNVADRVRQLLAP